MNRSPVIFGMSGTTITSEEKSFFKQSNPFGYIVFARNIESQKQMLTLTDALRELSGDENIPILVDQEGGRVARLKPPLVKEYKNAAYFGQIALDNMDNACEEVFLNYRNIGLDLRAFGLNVDCAPVADLLVKSAHDIIGDRSFGESVEIVVSLCESAISGLLSAGVQPIVKHIPGHGRAMCDSHLDLPIVDTDLATLEQQDFAIFKQLRHLDIWAMTAHIIFTEIDQDECITTSRTGMDYIRNNLGYADKLIMSDDLSMKALKRSVGENAIMALNAGCNIVLHCNGNMEEMIQVQQSITDTKF